MPSYQPLSLADYADLISSLPCLQQAFETKRSTWDRHIANSDFRRFYEELFAGDTTFISRADVFRAASTDYKRGVFSAICWGYPRNMRGNSFDTILESLPVIEKALISDKDLNQESFQRILNSISRTGVGLSTLSKLLYFFGFSLDGYRCLILDKRILDVIASGRFEELQSLRSTTARSTYRLYSSYLKVIHEISSVSPYSAEQLEFFVFLLGRNLKKSKQEHANKKSGDLR